MPGKFDAATLDFLRREKEISIHPGKAAKKGVVIWVVVTGDAVFVRSVRGPAGTDGACPCALSLAQLPEAVNVASGSRILNSESILS